MVHAKCTYKGYLQRGHGCPIISQEITVIYAIDLPYLCTQGGSTQRIPSPGDVTAATWLCLHCLISHPLKPHGHVFHASFLSQSEWRPYPHASDIIYTSHSISFIPSLDSTPSTSSFVFSNRLTASCINQPTSLITPIKGTSDLPYLHAFILFDSPTSTR